MLNALRNKLNDARTLGALCEEAERVARSAGNKEPGSEHFVLASLCLQDGTARRALASLGATPEAFGEAIRAQFVEALSHAGLETRPDSAPDTASSRAPDTSKLYHAAASGQSLVQRLASSAEGRKPRPLLSADVLVAVAEEEFSIAARALRVLGITPQQLVQAASREIARHEQGQGDG